MGKSCGFYLSLEPLPFCLLKIINCTSNSSNLGTIVLISDYEAETNWRNMTSMLLETVVNLFCSKGMLYLK